VVVTAEAALKVRANWEISQITAQGAIDPGRILVDGRPGAW